MGLPALLQDRLRLPVVGAPMFTVSTPELVVAQCCAGIIGAFPALNARPQTKLRDWITHIRAELADHDVRHPGCPSAPFAINLIVHRSNERLEDDLAVLVEFEVPIVITSLGARPEVNKAVHGYGGLVLHDVIHNDFARKAIAKGADGLIAVAAGAGGHGGTQSPFALVQEIRSWFDGPLLLSGAIANGRSILAARALGADLAYIGSAFIATREAGARDDYKRMIVDSSAQDIVYTDLFSGVHGNYLKGSIEAAGYDSNDLPEAGKALVGYGNDASDAKAWRDIWGAGQGIGAVGDVPPAAEVVARLIGEYEEAIEVLTSVSPRK